MLRDSLDQTLLIYIRKNDIKSILIGIVFSLWRLQLVLKEDSKLIHWNYFLVLESYLQLLARYIEFTSENDSVFSQEISHILLTAGSEVDVVLKALCKQLDSSFNGETITSYRKFLNPIFPKISRLNVNLPRYGRRIIPWDNWRVNTKPQWWDAYNKVKHYRDEKYKQANLKNVIASLAGLFIANLYFYKDKAENGELVPEPKVFRIQEDSSRLLEVSERGFVKGYILE